MTKLGNDHLSRSIRFAEEARSLVGTPFVPNGRTKYGTDCGGLVIVAARAMGLNLDISPTNVPAPVGYIQKRLEREGFRRKSCSDVSVGNVVTFNLAGYEHCGIAARHPFGGLTIIHNGSIKRGTVEHTLDKSWQRRILAVYELPEVSG